MLAGRKKAQERANALFSLKTLDKCAFAGYDKYTIYVRPHRSFYFVIFSRYVPRFFIVIRRKREPAHLHKEKTAGLIKKPGCFFRLETDG